MSRTFFPVVHVALMWSSTDHAEAMNTRARPANEWRSLAALDDDDVTE